MKQQRLWRRLAWLGMAGLLGHGVAAAASERVPAARRDPFWPIGYRPPVVQEPTEPVRPTEVPEVAVTEVHWQEAERDVGIHPPRYLFAELEGEARIAVRGQLRSEGDTVQFRKDGILFKWRVLAVSREGVRFERLTAESASGR